MTSLRHLKGGRWPGRGRPRSGRKAPSRKKPPGSWHKALATKAASKKRRASAKERELAAECKRLDALDLPWSLEMPPGNGFFNVRGVHALAGYTIRVYGRTGSGERVRYDWEYAENARLVAKAALVHPSGRLEFQGPFEVKPALEDLVLTVPRQFQPRKAGSAWLSACGVVDPFGLPGADEATSGVTAG